jgi:hypothetical protein
MVVLIAIVVVAVLVLGLIEPTDILVSRSTVIKAPKEAVFEQMVMFKNWPNWSPWYKTDSTMKMTYSGTDGQPGSSYHWVGDEKKAGEGEMKNTAVNGTELTFDVTFTKPDRGTAHGILKAVDTAGMTKATWSFSIHIGFPWNAMCVFMNMDKMLGGDFESGLANMKQYVESHATPAAPEVNIQEVDFPEHVYVGIRKTINMADIMKFFADNKGMNVKASGSYTGLFYTWDMATKTTDLAAVYPVSDTAMLAKGTSVIHVPAAKAYLAVLRGGYAPEMKYHNALHQRLEAKGQKQLVVVEEYPTGQYNEPDSNKWVTNIYYLVQ